MAGTNVAIINVLYHPHSVFGDKVYNGLLENLFNSNEISLDKDFKVPIFKIPYYEYERELPHFDTKLWKDYDFNFLIIVLDLFYEDNEENLSFLTLLKTLESTYPNTFIICVTDTLDIGDSRVVKLFSSTNFLRPFAFIDDNDLGIPITEDNLFSIFCIEFFHSMIKIIKKFSQQEKVRLFLSHAKLDGKQIAKSLKRTIESVTQLARFFDVQDIGIREDFNKNIENVIESKDIVFLIILTDFYSSRTSCKMEVLHAKLHQKPIILINAIERFEKRSFPYLNNTPVVKWANTVEGCLSVVQQALYEFLKQVLVEKEISNFLNESYISVNKVLFSTPELLTIAQTNINLAKEFIIIHPSPDMDQQEKALFNAIAPNIKFITPWS